ncbi:hypothetical protein DPMN_194527 [Dreissena polymorpha]|uniref:Uncharacterized protein n=2 Tax=Dreissena polymorpha TaxID=45954 RepID=A0A9D3Y6B8_DREPO|nr:hypothetical protein DPMN_194527 [Dreissena polymorpha]
MCTRTWSITEKNRTVLILMVLTYQVLANEYSQQYSCYADTCNLNTSVEYCGVVLRHCRRCEDVQNDFFTRMMTCNCTKYCYDRMHTIDIEKLREPRRCVPLWTVTVVGA